MAVPREKVWLCFEILIILLACDSTEARSRQKRSDTSCSSSTRYITGFQVTSPTGEAICQGRPKPYWGQTTQCNWQAIELMDYPHWNQCPQGFFLQADTDREMKCCKPSSHPPSYPVCSELTVEDGGAPNSCPDQHFITQIENTKCANQACTNSIKCCKMFDPLPSFATYDEVKRRAQDDTVVPLSYLAHLLGFGWCGGCRGQRVGENFKRTAYGWEGETEGQCEGYMSDHRLRITYSDWRQKISNFRRGFNKIEGEIVTSKVVQGLLVNNQSSSVTFTVGSELERRHTVSHSKLSSYTMSHEAGFEVSYSTEFGVSNVEVRSSYTFGYENTEETVTANENEETSKLNVETEVPMDPCSATHYEIHLYSKSRSEEYEADIQTEFSVQLDGFLRYGGGANGPSTNFHNEHRGSEDRPTVSHKFGGKGVPFYEDLKLQVEEDRDPWQWQNMKSRYTTLADTVIGLLTDNKTHVFTVRGKLEEQMQTTADAFFTRGEPPAGCTAPDNTETQRRKREADHVEDTWMRTFDFSTGKWSDIKALPDIPLNEKGFPKITNADKRNKEDQKKAVYFIVDQESNLNHDFDITFIALEDFTGNGISVGTRIQASSGLALIIACVVTTLQMKGPF